MDDGQAWTSPRSLTHQGRAGFKICSSNPTLHLTRSPRSRPRKPPLATSSGDPFSRPYGVVASRTLQTLTAPFSLFCRDADRRDGVPTGAVIGDSSRKLRGTRK